MKAENMMDAMGRLDEQLLAESLPAKRRNFRPLVAVAAVAAALAVTAGAAGLFGDDHWLLFYSTQDWGEQFTVQATYGGTVFSSEQLAEWKADIERGTETVFHRSDGSMMDAVVHSVEYRFSTLEQVERFLEVDLLETPLAAVSDCRVMATADESGTLYVDVSCAAEMDGQILQICAYLSNGEDVQMSMHHEINPMARPSQYDIQSLGVTAYEVENLNQKGKTVCFFTKDGIAYEVSIVGDAKTAEQILDSFHY